MTTLAFVITEPAGGVTFSGASGRAPVGPAAAASLPAEADGGAEEAEVSAALDDDDVGEDSVAVDADDVGDEAEPLVVAACSS